MPFVPTDLTSSSFEPNVPASTGFDAPGLPRRRVQRRRPNREQGRALEMLGHAIEYLADSELHSSEKEFSRNVSEATLILMGRSRDVFAECPEIVPFGETVRETLIRMFGRPALMLRPAAMAGLRPDTLAR